MSEGLGPVGTKSLLNITTAVMLDAVTVSSYAARRISHVHVLVAGSTAGSVSDCATLGAVAASNLVFSIPNTVGIYLVDFPMILGIAITPGTGQVVSVSYD